MSLRIGRQDVHLSAGTRKLQNHEMLKTLDTQACTRTLITSSIHGFSLSKLVRTLQCII